MHRLLPIVYLIAMTGCSTARVEDPVVAAKAREGRAEIRRLEKTLISNRIPDEFDYERFVRALRDAGRPVEGDALIDYVSRARGGEHMNLPSTKEQRAKCDDRRLIRRWGRARSQPDEFTSRVGRLTAKFWIGADATIEKIRVVRAMDPGAAWILIDAIGESRVSRSRVRRKLDADPDEFPLELCTSWNHDEIRDRFPAGNNIRGS